MVPSLFLGMVASEVSQRVRGGRVPCNWPQALNDIYNAACLVEESMVPLSMPFPDDSWRRHCIDLAAVLVIVACFMPEAKGHCGGALWA